MERVEEKDPNQSQESAQPVPAETSEVPEVPVPEWFEYQMPENHEAMMNVARALINVVLNWTLHSQIHQTFDDKTKFRDYVEYWVQQNLLTVFPKEAIEYAMVNLDAEKGEISASVKIKEGRVVTQSKRTPVTLFAITPE